MLGTPLITEAAEVIVSMIITSAAVKGVFDTVSVLVKEKLGVKVAGGVEILPARISEIQNLKALSDNLKAIDNSLESLIKSKQSESNTERNL